MSFLMPLGPELLRHNLHILGKAWPEGVVEAIERIEEDNPGWLAHWQSREPAGYHAGHRDQCSARGVHGATPDELRAAIRSHRCSHWPPLA